MKSRRVTCVAALLLTAAIVIPSFGAEPEVEARIEIPPAEVYVLGDNIPIIWEFTNRSTNSLAMLWEGCCRLNGKLDISAAGQPVNILPPGAASFHSYSKAAELQTDVPNRFSSLLSDWVKLPSGGGFKIAGRYTGVLPSQSPQVAEGLELWRGSSIATAVELDILSVANYLDQRESRSRENGIELMLNGADKLPPLESVSLSLSIKNIGTTPKEFAWPGPVQLWIVDENGYRLPQGTRHLRQSGEKFLLQPGQTIQRKIGLNSADLNGAPFGKHQIFLDMTEPEPGSTRVPSNSMEIDWNLSPDDIVQLLNSASGGPSTGMRNPPLKLLRLYLDEIGRNLTSISNTELNEKAAVLKHQLELATCVKPIRPRPGRAFLRMELSATANARLQLPDDGDCALLNSASGIRQIQSIYKIRRHLGWDIGVELVPESETPSDSIFEFIDEINAANLKLAGPPVSLIRSPTGLTNTIRYSTQPAPANIIVRFDTQNGTEKIFVALKEQDPKKPAWLNMYSAAQVMEIKGEPLSAKNVNSWVETLEIKSPQVVVIVENSVSWKTLLQNLEPLFRLSSPLTVVRRVGDSML